MARYFYKTLEGVPVAPIMIAVMDRQNLFSAGPENSVKAEGVSLRNGTGDKEAMAAFGAKKLALSVLQLSDGVQLGNVGIIRIEPTGKLQQSALDGWSRFYVVLLGIHGAAASIGDETVNLRSGEIWWADGKQSRMIMNNSGDDLVILQIDVKTVEA